MTRSWKRYVLCCAVLQAACFNPAQPPSDPTQHRDPRRGDVFDVDPRLPELVEDPNEKKPEYWDDREFIMQPNYDKGVDELVKNENYNGVWKPQLIDNRES